MKRILVLLGIFCLLSGSAWAVTAKELVAYFEDSQTWVNSAMMAFKVTKKASDKRIADMFDFVSDHSYDYEGMLINGARFKNGNSREMGSFLGRIGTGVLGVIHKLATDENRKLFKPTWVGYHTANDKKVSNWFCMIMGNHTKTYLTRVDSRSKLDEIGADPLGMSYLNKNLFDFEVVKDLGERAVLKITPKPKAYSNVKEGLIEMAKLQVGDASTWYVTKISGVLQTGASGETSYGNFRVAAAPSGAYVAWSEDGTLKGSVPTWGIATALQQKVSPSSKLYVFATQVSTTTYQKSQEVKDYEVNLVTNVKRLHINPAPETMFRYITAPRLKTLEKITQKIVGSH